ncbi:MAG: undecaprenyldiphospho-muramoylpentapeptide beta-N-acetylglucosaminyltransferase [Verrucomicrobiales bacterium]
MARGGRWNSRNEETDSLSSTRAPIDLDRHELAVKVIGKDVMSLRVVIACGGTGGHLFPGIAVAEALTGRGHEPLLLISEKEIDSVAARDHPALRFEKVPAVGMPPWLSPRLVPFVVKFWKTFRRTRRVLREFRADAVLGMGGFTSLPPVLSGRLMGAKTFIHESNAIPGKANRLTARFCDVVLLGMPACSRHFAARQCRVVGTPLRAALRRVVPTADAYACFGLDPAKQTVLIMGGSQGARAINRAVIEALPRLDPERVQLIHLTGPDDEVVVRDAVRQARLQAFIAPFSARLDRAYTIADMCVARCGGSSLAEIAHFGVPAILIPYSYAADDHQTRNAEAFAANGAAIMVPEADLRPAHLGELISDLLRDEGRRSDMRRAMRELAIPDAAERICDVIEHTGRG